MEGQVTCYIKRIRGSCLKEKIKVIDQKICEKKQYYHFILSQIQDIESCFNKKKYFVLLTRTLTFFDGFNFKKKEEWTDIKSDFQLKCPYQLHGCEAIYKLKKNVLAYHTNRLLTILNDYNQWMHLLYTLQGWYRQNKGYDMVLTYSITPFLSIGCYQLEKKCWSHGQYQVFNVFYAQDYNAIKIESLTWIYQISEEAMSGTYLSHQDQQEAWIQIIIKSIILDEQIVESLIRCFRPLIGQISQRHKVYGKRIVGNYIDISKMTDANKRYLIHTLKPLGYKPIGRMVAQSFKENQLLIYMFSCP